MAELACGLGGLRLCSYSVEFSYFLAQGNAFWDFRAFEVSKYLIFYLVPERIKHLIRKQKIKSAHRRTRTSPPCCVSLPAERVLFLPIVPLLIFASLLSTASCHSLLFSKLLFSSLSLFYCFKLSY